MAAPASARTGTAPAAQYLPSLCDLFFVALVVWLFGVGAGWSGLLLDGDTGWHIKTGEYILAGGRVPQADLFSFSKPGEPWFAWEWLADVVFALLHRTWGLAGVAVMSGVLICLTATLLLRNMISAGANGFAAGLLTLLFVGAGSIHYHARPHIFTMVFLAAAVWMVRLDLERPSRRIWMLVPLATLWTNLHGGWPVLVALLGLVAAGRGIETWLDDRRDWSQPVRYGALAAACVAASLVNPYGWHLHAHIISYLRSGFIQGQVQEFQSPSFRSESVLQYEVILFAAIACSALLLRRKQVAWPLVMLYLAHASLVSARHIPLFVIAVAPVVAPELTRLWRDVVERTTARSTARILDGVARDVGAGLARSTFWAPAGLAAVLLLTPDARFPREFGDTFPVAAVTQEADALRSGRVFTTDQWADYLIYKLYPGVRVFFDGRSDFYGGKLAQDYLTLAELQADWQAVLHKHRFDTILLPVDYPLSSALKLTAGWRVVYDDGKTILFTTRAAVSAEKSAKAGLMERTTTAESTK